MAFMGAALNEFGMENLHTVYKKNREVSRINWKSGQPFPPLAFLFSKCGLPPFQPTDPFAAASLCGDKKVESGRYLPALFGLGACLFVRATRKRSESPTNLEKM
jgi:hypothetical protein